MEKITSNISVKICRRINNSNVALGTGFFLSQKGHIITCYHVIEGIPFDELIAELQLQEGTLTLELEIDESKVNPNLIEDLVILKSVPVQNYSVPVFNFNRNDPTYEETLITFGFPDLDSFQSLFSKGSYIGTVKTKKGKKMYQCRFKEVISGFSGAPVITVKDNKLIGLIQSITKNVDKNEETTFVIPSEKIKKFYQKYISESTEENNRNVSFPKFPFRSSVLKHSLITAILSLTTGYLFIKVFYSSKSIKQKPVKEITYSKLNEEIKKAVSGDQKESVKSHPKVTRNKSSILKPAKKRGTSLYGFINDQNQFVIPAIYDSVVPFKGNLSFVKRNDFWESIDSEGNRLTNLKLQRLPFISKRGYFITEIGEKLTVYNNLGIEVINSKDYFSSISNIRQFITSLDCNQADKDLILRVLTMSSDPGNRHKDLMNLSKSYTVIDKNMYSYILERASEIESRK